MRAMHVSRMNPVTTRIEANSFKATVSDDDWAEYQDSEFGSDAEDASSEMNTEDALMDEDEDEDEIEHTTNSGRDSSDSGSLSYQILPRAPAYEKKLHHPQLKSIHRT